MDSPLRSHAPLLAALCLGVTAGYGALYYGFAVLITEPAAGGDFSRALLSAAYGGAVLTGGAVALPVGRLADRRRVRALVTAGSLIAAAGLLAFSAATKGWQVLAVWWLVLGPATALTFYEPAYVAIQQAFGPRDRARAIAALTLAAGFSGPIFTPLTGALVDSVGWRDTTRILAAALFACAPLLWLFVRPRVPSAAPEPDPPPPTAGRSAPSALFRTPRLRLFTVGAILAYGALEAVVIHRVARWQELGFSLTTVTVWAAVSGLLTLPGRFLLPLLGRRLPATGVLAAVLLVLAGSTALMITGDHYWQMVLSYVLFGLVFGAALPLRAIVMGEWVATAIYGTAMGIQAAVIAFSRAGTPALAGAMHDWLSGYTAAMALVSALLVAGALLVAASGTRAPG